MAQYSGTIRDAQTETPLPGATVTFLYDGLTMHALAANNDGQFLADLPLPVTNIQISSAGYISNIYPASIYQHTFDLERNVLTMPPVTVTDTPGPPVAQTKKNSWLFLGIAALLLMTIKKK